MQALNLDADSNLWVAGDHTITKVFTDPAAIIDGVAIPSTSANILLSTSRNPPIDIALGSTFITYPPTNPVPDCNYYAPTLADEDLWDTGIVISRSFPNNIYVANTGSIGKV